MAVSDIPRDVRQLLHDHIETYAQLETLIRMAADCDRRWTSAELARELAIPVASIVEAVDHLQRSGLIEQSPEGGGATFGCRPHQAILPLLGRLAEAYRVNRLDVINLMSTNAVERVRTAAMRAFARAFQLRNRDDV